MISFFDKMNSKFYPFSYIVRKFESPCDREPEPQAAIHEATKRDDGGSSSSQDDFGSRAYQLYECFGACFGSIISQH